MIRWIYSNESKAKQLKILIIDDEADQASINTKNIESEERTAINNAILELVNCTKVKGMNYIAYTATPYANILNDTSEESLYPKNFIILLEPSEDYIGPKQIFGAEEPETNPYIDIVRSISDADAEEIRESQIEYDTVPLVNSLRESTHWFILTVAAMRILDYRKPISMLVHTSFKIVEHEKLAKTIENYLKNFKINYKNILPKLKDMYENESLDFKRSHFLEGMRDYSTKELVPEYPKWDEMEKYIERMIRLDDKEFISHIPIDEEGQAKYHKGFHVVIDNSSSKANNQIVRLVYPKETQSTAPAFIVIGGNTLSRGLTLEGLTTTYFLRATNQADTLMQMGRWFGYRKGYEIFPRIWLDSKSLERYQFLSQMNEELRDVIAEYAEKGYSTADYGLRIKNSADYQLIRITSSNKMQSAEPHEFDFTGFNSQTVYFENDIQKLETNLENTKQFLNNLPTPEISSSNMIWRDIPVELVKQFLENYLVYELDIKMKSLPVLIKWVTEQSSKFSDWNVVLSSVGKIEETENQSSDWMIHGYSPKSVTRTKMKNRSSEKVASIGALRGPADLVADIREPLESVEKKMSKVSEIRKIREKYGYNQIPLLTIFKIDKGQVERNVKENREILNFERDVIGINIMLPGFSKGNSMTTYVSAKVKIDDENNFTEETEYED
ncbi:MAG: Z1 domain-containing protein [Aestuariibaculum sp.]